MWQGMHRRARGRRTRHLAVRARPLGQCARLGVACGAWTPNLPPTHLAGL